MRQIDNRSLTSILETIIENLPKNRPAQLCAYTEHGPMEQTVRIDWNSVTIDSACYQDMVKALTETTADPRCKRIVQQLDSFDPVEGMVAARYMYNLMMVRYINGILATPKT
jgi:hypothetical protein